jgi:hypothetical protein
MQILDSWGRNKVTRHFTMSENLVDENDEPMCSPKNNSAEMHTNMSAV